MKRCILLFTVFLCGLFAFGENNKQDIRLVLQNQHKERIDYIKYCADEKYIFTTDRDAAKLWDLNSGRLIRSVAKKANQKCDISPDGKTLIYITENNDLASMDIESGKETKIVNNIGKSLSEARIAFSPDGKMYSVIMDDHTLYIYDALKNTTIKRLTAQTLYYKSAVFSKDSRYLIEVYKKDDYGIFIYDIQLGQTKSVPCKNSDLYNCIVDVSFDNKYVAAGLKDGSVLIISINDGTIVNTIQISDGYGLHSICFTTDNTLMTASDGNGKGIQEWDYLKDKKLAQISYKDDENDSDFFGAGVIAVSSNNKFFAEGGYRNFVIKSLPDNKIVQSFGDFSRISDIVYFYNSDNYCFITYKNGYSFSSSLDQMECLATNGVYKMSCYDGGFYYLNNKNDDKQTHIYSYDFKTRQNKEVLTIKKKYENIQFPSRTGKDILVFGTELNKTIYVYDMVNKKLIQSFPGMKKKDFLYEFYENIVTSSNGRYVAFYSFGQDTKVFDCIKKKFINLKGAEPSFSPDEKYCMTYDYNETGNINIYDTNTWKIVKRLEGMNSGAMSPDNTYFATTSKGSSYSKIWIYHFPSQKLIKEIQCFSYFNSMHFISDNTKLILEAGGIAWVYSVETGELLACSCCDDENNWLTYTPDGYFNGNDGGINKFLHLVDGMKVSELGQYAEALFRPDMVASRLRGEKATETISLSEIVSSGEAPEVSFVNTASKSPDRDVTVNFSVQDMGGGVGSVYIKLNGKVIQLADGSRKLELIGGTADTTKKTNGKTVTYSHLLTLQNGENTIEAYATNSAGLIESRHAVTKINWTGTTEKPSLYLLAIGVNKYRDRSLWLNYAVPDATSIADSFKNVKGNLYKDANITTIFDEEVTSTGISQAFDSLASKVTADDVFIFYISGHGTTHTDGDYYFIPVDFRFKNAESVPETAISKHFITENLSKIKAQKSLVMLDTCNSGAFISTGARGMAEKTAIDRLSRATGQATIAASSDTQSAMEGYEGHGIFTYVILEGLSGKADLNNDGFISLSELSSYAEETVPDLSYKKWGYEQYPQIDLRKQSNFPLAGK